MATMIDLGEHERRQRLLLDELNHRVKNTLMSVQSIATQTLRHSADMESFHEAFLGRLMALSATHDLLVRRHWERATLRELVDTVLGRYGRPYHYLGLPVMLHPNRAVTLGMALHELATNALKHGAWKAAGRIVLQVRSNGDEGLCITWREQGGGAVEPPGRRGFGVRLLERGVAAELGGRVTVEFAREGLAWTICAPASESFHVSPVT